MPYVILDHWALRDLQRFKEFLLPKGADLAGRAREAILYRLFFLEDSPYKGKPVQGLPEEYRRLVIKFGKGERGYRRGYAAIYRVDGERVTVLTMKRALEKDFPRSVDEIRQRGAADDGA
ncbi:MAG: type II toxin-antitoxin system RelE/ParE family toxin [Ottowia sp.]|nr:type II toxin-antitoxin system RelE/ParE family toxin [Ottowia sp.]